MTEDLDQGKQGCQPDLMVLAGDAFFQLRQVDGAPAFFDHPARHRNLDSQELITFAVLSRPGLEETGQPRHLGRVGLGKHPAQKRVHSLAAELGEEAGKEGVGADGETFGMELDAGDGKRFGLKALDDPVGSDGAHPEAWG